MQRIAPSEKDDATESPERDLRYAVDQFRTNSGLGSQESVVKALISMPESLKEACSIPPTVRVPLKSF
jgi:hypothetical protein